jgi:hypothetical protein
MSPLWGKIFKLTVKIRTEKVVENSREHPGFLRNRGRPSLKILATEGGPVGKHTIRASAVFQ